MINQQSETEDQMEVKQSFLVIRTTYIDHKGQVWSFWSRDMAHQKGMARDLEYRISEIVEVKEMNIKTKFLDRKKFVTWLNDNYVRP